ncbi:ATP-dependent endonuclease [Micromonospora sp. MA102]|uniref:ATP-dependent nuclease n=1 Tax=Micromonospora sp. MA102 TaxID=2952755 RepID=UPI0021C687FD|nr:AAA family ATPase [Micromonospora sp. MA102]
MRLTKLRVKNFQCFGPEPTMLEIDEISYLLGPNGSGKTSVLTALARMFAAELPMRRIRPGDFHAAIGTSEAVAERELWIEVEFSFPELGDDTAEKLAVPDFFHHMQLQGAGEVPTTRIRLTATIDEVNEIDERLEFVTSVDPATDEPVTVSQMGKYDRNLIQVHYLPARRDPADHIAYTSGAMLGKLMRSIDWSAQHAVIEDLGQQMSDCLGSNVALTAFGTHMTQTWAQLHTGAYFQTPQTEFTRADIDSVLRHFNITFDPAPGGGAVDWTRLSDGQQSLLYLTLVITLHRIGREVRAGQTQYVDAAKLRPASFTLIALEEPENSLSPHYLGRVTKLLTEFASQPDAQVVVATHSPSVVRRVIPSSIRHLRLNEDRRTVISTIELPPKSHEAHKFVREAVEAFPELYFARLVIMGEGDSEQIVIPRLLEAAGLTTDLNSISVVPLGGRHVNHFWRLLNRLGIPHVTLLDLDVGRHQAGWGRLRYAYTQLLEHAAPETSSTITNAKIDLLPKWDDPAHLIRDQGSTEIATLEGYGVFYSTPLDLDFAMLSAFPDAYGLDQTAVAPPDDDTLKAVLGRARRLENQYTADEASRFANYQRLFINGSKPAEHLSALSKLADAELEAGMPDSIKRLICAVDAKLRGLPE